MAFHLTAIRARALSGVALVGFMALVFAPAQANAQDEQPPAEEGGLSEIVVTAQRREENLQQVPIAVSAVTAEALERSGIGATKDLPQIVPSVQMTRSGPSGLFFVRGVGTTNAAAGEEGANAVYVDNVYLGDLAQTINNFNNIQRVEVLKGPQGTLFGRNSTGGLIHIITREPGDELVIDGKIGLANYETVNTQLYVGGPLGENVSADIAVTQKHQNEGWGRNLTRGTKSKVDDYWGVRSKLVLRASDAVKFTLSGDYFESDDNLGLAWKIKPGVVGTGGALGPSGHDTTSNEKAITSLEIWGTSLTGEFDLGFATLTSISALRKTTNHSDFDVDGGPAPLIRIQYASGAKTFQQEFRLASNDTDPFSWQLGAFYLHSTANNDSIFSGLAFGALPAPFGPARSQHIVANLKTDSYAAFGEATYAITPTTKLTGGIRYTMDRRTFFGSQANTLFNNSEVPGGLTTVPGGVILPTPGVQHSKLKYNEFTWRVALRQEITDDVSVYASANRGFKAGSYSLQNPFNDPYLPQFITAYEVGLKSELFDRRLRLNVSAFHYDIDDYQVRSAAVAAPGSSLILNAAAVKVDGVELEFEAAPTDQLRLFGGVTYLDSRFDKFGGVGSTFQAPIVYPNANSNPDVTLRTRCPANLRGTENPGIVGTGALTGGYTTCFGDVSGNRTPNAPKWSASFGASYTVPVGENGEVRMTALYSYNDGYVFEPDNLHRQDSYSLFNASLEYKPSENLGIEFWGKNLFNKEYAVQDLTTATGTTEALGAPRTYGVNLNYHF